MASKVGAKESVVLMRDLCYKDLKTSTSDHSERNEVSLDFFRVEKGTLHCTFAAFFVITTLVS